MQTPPPDREGPQRFAPYERYATVYDAIGQREFGERIAEATIAYLDGIGLNPSSSIDLACGTGAATGVFAAAGMMVTGVDRAQAMLYEAAKRFQSEGLSGIWIEQDIRDPITIAPAELVTCFYDSLNYILLATELTMVFRNALQLTSQGGRFIFDLNTRAKLSAVWNDSCYVAANREDIFGVYQSWYEPATGISPLTMTFFVRDAAGFWERFDEEHVERAYPLEEVHALLIESGFDLEAMLDYRDRAQRFGPPGNEESHRVVFVCRRSQASG